MKFFMPLVFIYFILPFYSLLNQCRPHETGGLLTLNFTSQVEKKYIFIVFFHLIEFSHIHVEWIRLFFFIQFLFSFFLYMYVYDYF